MYESEFSNCKGEIPEITANGNGRGDNMTANLIAELVKMGIQPRNAAKVIAKAIGVSEKTARNKINGITEWKLPEAVTINEEFFGGNQSVEYLFSRIEAAV